MRQRINLTFNEHGVLEWVDNPYPNKCRIVQLAGHYWPQEKTSDGKWSFISRSRQKNGIARRYKDAKNALYNYRGAQEMWSKVQNISMSEAFYRWSKAKMLLHIQAKKNGTITPHPHNRPTYDEPKIEAQEDTTMRVSEVKNKLDSLEYDKDTFDAVRVASDALRRLDVSDYSDNFIKALHDAVNALEWMLAPETTTIVVKKGQYNGRI